MKTVAKLLCIAILLAIPGILLADSDRDNYYSRERGWSVTGRVISVSTGEKTLEIYDNSHRHYTVETDGAKIYEGDRERRLRDIRKDDLVQVYGEERRMIVRARSIFKLDGDDYRHREYGERVRLNGTIKKIGKNKDVIDLRTDGRTEKVQINRETDIYSARNRRVDLDYLRKDDDIRVEGYRSRGNQIIATTIYAGDRRDDRNSRGLQVRVVKETSFFDRKLRVTSLEGGRLPDVFEVKVPKGIEIIRDNRNISVHDVHVGEILRMEGDWRGDTFVPSRIRVEGREYDRYSSESDYRTLRGTIRRIDRDSTEFTLQTDRGQYRVYADRARVWNGDSVREFRTLRQGDEVWVRGNIEGDKIDAERIETSRGGLIYRLDT